MLVADGGASDQRERGLLSRISSICASENSKVKTLLAYACRDEKELKLQAWTLLSSSFKSRILNDLVTIEESLILRKYEMAYKVMYQNNALYA